VDRRHESAAQCSFVLALDFAVEEHPVRQSDLDACRRLAVSIDSEIGGDTYALA
jgi:hypothetical protein